jgi:hypothetical protein
LEEVKDGDGECEDSACKDEEEDLDLVEDLDDDCNKVTDALVHSQFK